jgi:hypothetical protein
MVPHWLKQRRAASLRALTSAEPAAVPAVPNVALHEL